MTGSTNREVPDAGRRLDESAVTPSPKAYTLPLVPVSDRLDLELKFDKGTVRIKCAAEVRRGLHGVVDLIAVALVL